ncbi:hypothetical protein LTR08_004577 [Meristemomyces frigidus]|nr:hypothetical protein LTR08_004577 [Meristemomyces frigidus]
MAFPLLASMLPFWRRGNANTDDEDEPKFVNTMTSPTDNTMATLDSRFSQGKRCFYAIVIIDLHHSCVKLTRTLFDTGASASFISRRVVNEYRLQSLQIRPTPFIVANGGVMYCNEIARFDLYIAGVRNEVQAYVHDSANGILLLVGVDIMDQYRMSMQSALGTQRRWKVTVAPDIKGYRRERHVVEEDEDDGPPKAWTLDRDEGLAWSRRHG